MQYSKPTKYNKGSPRRNFYSYSCLITKSEISLIKKNFMMYYKVLEKTRTNQTHINQWKEMIKIWTEINDVEINQQ